MDKETEKLIRTNITIILPQELSIKFTEKIKSEGTTKIFFIKKVIESYVNGKIKI